MMLNLCILHLDELEDLSVLHPNMCKYFLCGCEYEKLQIEEDNDVEISIKMLDKLLTNLQWLLSLHYEQFWCQVLIYFKSVCCIHM